MSLRTRLACIAILLLIGWILVAPHYRTADVSAVTDLDQPSPPPLQLQRSPIKEQASTKPLLSADDRFDTSGQTSTNSEGQTDPSGGRDKTLETPFHSVVAAASSGLTPSPGVGLAPRPVGYSSSVDPLAARAPQPPPAGSLTPTPIGKPGATLPQIKPVTLIVSDIGSPVIGRTNNGKETIDQRLGPHSLVPQDVPHSSDNRSDEAVQDTDNVRPLPSRSQSAPRLLSVDESPRPSASDPAPSRARSQWHRVVDGDSLQSIAREYYGSLDFALVIFEANRHTLVSPTILPLGAELRIPSKSEVARM